MRSVLILFATSHGMTRTISQKLAADLRAAGHYVVLHDLAARPPGPAGFDAVVLGSRVHFDRHARSLYRYVRRHRAALDPGRTWLYSVSMTAAAGEQGDAGDYLASFIRRSGFDPHRSVSLAGALAYTEYGPITRRVMKRISARLGGDTDTSINHEYTDWAEVARLGREIGASLVRRSSTTVVLPAPTDPPAPPAPSPLGPVPATPSARR